MVAAPYHLIGRRLDALHIVAVGHVAIPGEIDHLAAGGAERRADGEQHRITETAAGQQHRLLRRNPGRLAGRPHQHHRFARLQVGAEVR